MNAMTNPGHIMTASRQWASRPEDERFTSLLDMQTHFGIQRDRSFDRVVTSRKVRAVPVDGDQKAMAIECLLDGKSTEISLPTHWSFGQVCERAKAPAAYMRTLPSELAADCVNHGLRRNDVQELKMLVRGDDLLPAPTLAAATGPNYGRIWNADIVTALVDRFGDGVTGPFKVPGEFGKAVKVTKENTTLYASDRDMFVFLADETNRIEIPNRRNGQAGSLARGFFVWNSEVGSQTFGIATFLFDFVCCNRIIWGADEYKEVRIRHTSGAPDRYIEEVAPALISYANSSSRNIEEAVANARQARLDDVDAFLGERFTGGRVKGIKLAFDADEMRPIETVWDAVTGITAYARGIANQDERVVIERAAGALMAKVA